MQSYACTTAPFAPIALTSATVISVYADREALLREDVDRAREAERRRSQRRLDEEARRTEVIERSREQARAREQAELAHILAKERLVQERQQALAKEKQKRETERAEEVEEKRLTALKRMQEHQMQALTTVSYRSYDMQQRPWSRSSGENGRVAQEHFVADDKTTSDEAQVKEWPRLLANNQQTLADDNLRRDEAAVGCPSQTEAAQLVLGTRSSERHYTVGHDGVVAEEKRKRGVELNAVQEEERQRQDHAPAAERRRQDMCIDMCIDKRI